MSEGNTDDVLRLSVEWTEPDIIDLSYLLNRRLQRRARMTRLLVAGLLVLVGAVFGLAGFIDTESSVNGLLIASGLFLTAAVFAVWHVWYWRTGPRRWSRRMLKESESAQLGPREIEIGAAGVRITSRDAEHNLRWHLVRDVINEDRAIYLVLSEVEAIILPKRFFAGESSIGRTMELIQGYRAASPPPETSCPKCGYSLLGRTGPRCPECGWARPEAAT